MTLSNIALRGIRKYHPLQFQYIILKRLNKKIAKRNLETYPQLAIFAFDNIGLQINLEGRYESDNLGALARFLTMHLGVNTNSTAIDIGANIGNHSVYFSEIFDKVLAYEPNPRVHSILAFNSAGMNIVPLNYGLSNENSTLDFSIDPVNLGGSKVLNRQPSPGGPDLNTIQIEVRRLDDDPHIADQFISLIKVDVEGHELRVLEGAANLIGTAQPIIIFEQSPEAIVGGTSDTIDFLRGKNYRFFTIKRNFEFGEGSFVKFASLLLRMAFGFRHDIVATTSFRKQFYHMIIAVPN